MELLAWALLAGVVFIGDFARLATSVPLGTERFVTVPLFNAWTIGWNAISLRRGFVDYWHAPIFYPQRGTFAFSEAQPTSLIVAPLFGLFESGALAYNVYLMLLLGLNALITRQLCRDLGFGRTVSCCGAAIVLLLPFVHWQLGVLQLTAICGPLAVIWSLVRFARSGSPGWALAAGLSSGLTYAACNHYGLFLSLLAPAFVVLLGRRLLEWSAWLKLAAGVLVAAAIAGPIVWAQYVWLKPHVEPRSQELITELSARPREYLVAPVSRFGSIPLKQAAGEEAREPLKLGVGSLLYLLALIGVVSGFCRRGRRVWTGFCLILGTLAWLWSLGPLLKLGDWTPYDWLMRWYPGLEFVRSPFRFAAVVQIACALLAAEALSLAEWAASLLRGGPWGHVVTFALAAAVVLQTGPARPKLVTLPSVAENRGWIDWLREKTPPGTAIVCVPFPEGTTVDAYEPAAKWMYLGLWHERPLAQGYSGFFPQQFRELKPAMRSFPAGPSLMMLRQRNIRYAVVRTPQGQKSVPDARSVRDAGASKLRPVFQDTKAGVTIYQLGE